MIPIITPGNAAYPEISTKQDFKLLTEGNLPISDSPFSYWNTERKKVFQLIFKLPKQDEFDHYVKEWHEERGATSSISEMSICPSYQKIIGLGKEVAVPLILRKLEEEGNEPDFWFWALSVLDIDNPPVIPEDAQGDFIKMSEIWINWGKQRNAHANWA